MTESVESISRLTGGFYSVGEVRLLSGVKEAVSRRFVKSYKGMHGLWGGGEQMLAGNVYLNIQGPVGNQACKRVPFGRGYLATNYQGCSACQAEVRDGLSIFGYPLQN